MLSLVQGIVYPDTGYDIKACDSMFQHSLLVADNLSCNRCGLCLYGGIPGRALLLFLAMALKIGSEGKCCKDHGDRDPSFWIIDITCSRVLDVKHLPGGSTTVLPVHAVDPV